jgi:hypothetical protein
MMMVGRCADGGQAVCWALSQGAQHNSFAKTGLLHYIRAINQDSAVEQQPESSTPDFPAFSKAAGPSGCAKRVVSCLPVLPFLT